MTNSFRALMAEAHRLGVQVQMAHLDGRDDEANYDHDAGLITLDLGSTICELKVTLAHELAHAHYGHTCNTDSNEARANRRAAQLLVDVNAYRRAEHINSDPDAIADELGITREAVRWFQKLLLPEIALSRGA